MSRTFGWIQDGGSFDNLKRVILSIVPESRLNQRLREDLIPNFVPNDILSNQMVFPNTHEKMRYTVYAYRHEWRLNVVMDDCVVVCTSQAMCEVNHSKYKIWSNVIDNPLWYTFTQTANGKPQFIPLAQESCSE